MPKKAISTKKSSKKIIEDVAKELASTLGIPVVTNYRDDLNLSEFKVYGLNTSQKELLINILDDAQDKFSVMYELRRGVLVVEEDPDYDGPDEYLGEDDGFMPGTYLIGEKFRSWIGDSDFLILDINDYDGFTVKASRPLFCRSLEDGPVILSSICDLKILNEYRGSSASPKESYAEELEMDKDRLTDISLKIVENVGSGVNVEVHPCTITLNPSGMPTSVCPEEVGMTALKAVKNDLIRLMK